MTTPILIVLVSLGVLFLWGLIAPRSQWRALASWSYRDPYDNEPSGAAYTLYRVVSVLGIASLVVSGVFVNRIDAESRPTPRTPPSAAARMWGAPVPVVVNRVARSEATAPSGLVEQPILGYQVVAGQTRQPPYLFDLKTFSLRAATTENGYIGVDPSTGLVALDSAKLVVWVSADPKCFAHAAIVKETEEDVSIAIYYGRATPADGSGAETSADCSVDANDRSVSTLIPLRLTDPLGKRDVLTIHGDPIRKVTLRR